jgi:quercetin dioxygenase-like cupin family protein
MKPLYRLPLVTLITSMFAAIPALAQDPVAIDAKHHKIEFENEQLRVLRITFAPGEAAPMHEHPCAIAVGVQDGALVFTYADGSTRDAVLKQAQVTVAKPTKHQVENKSGKPVEVILVEMKTGTC